MNDVLPTVFSCNISNDNINVATNQTQFRNTFNIDRYERFESKMLDKRLSSLDKLIISIDNLSRSIMRRSRPVYPFVSNIESEEEFIYANQEIYN